ncbi:Cuticle protein 3 [Eumeta japonica]|uniref:Cuticle protein 3 n=1 Tax=Eumeta variegata TaxID=151549 RepID=A0A4C1WID0_EUMVA|nr:Cuticle protein 3 [Eumeta japonica]
MRSIVLISILSFTCAAKLDKTYLPPSGAQTSGGSGDFLQTPSLSGSGFQKRPDTKGPAGDNAFGRNSPAGPGRTDLENDAVVINAALPNDAYEGASAFDEFQRAERPQSAYERNAGILRQDSVNNGDTYSYSYETENGIFCRRSRNGFVPEGDHLPTSPPVPEEILKALEQNAREEAAGIFDDGSYDVRKYGGQEENFDSQNNNGNNGNKYDNFSKQGNTYLPPNGAPTVTNQNAQRGQSLGQNFDSARRRPGSESTDGYSY